MYNRVILVGNLSRDVELKYTTSGTAIGQFGIATNRTYKDASTGETKQEVMFIDVKVFRKSAEVAKQYLAKGRRVLVEGRLVFEQWVDSTGQKRSKHSIVAEKLQFMDSKTQSEGEFDSSKPQMQSQTKQNEVSSIDIDEEDIPF